jgi:DNA-binding response OmpR family regulator
MPTLLIVDDEVAIQESLKSYFQDLGFGVYAVGSTEEALAHPALPEIAAAIVDIRLPGRDGVFCLQALATQYPSMRLLVHTGSLDFELDPEIQRLGVGADQVFLKPLHDLDVLRAALERLGVRP